MDAKTTAKFLQTQLNRYVKLTRLAPLVVDGAIGKGTTFATKSALNEIVSLSSQYMETGAAAWKDYHQFAWNYLNTVDANNPTTVISQAYALADLFQKFGNFNGDPILKDTWSTTTTTTTTVKPTTVATTPKPPTTTTTKPPAVFTPVPVGPVAPTAAATVNFLGLKLPRVALYVGGGALALAIVALIATRKPRAGVPAAPH